MDIVRRPIFLSFLIQFQTNFLKGFDPLWRSGPARPVIRESPGERLVVSLALHKRKADKWEVRLFLSSLTALCRALPAGRHRDLHTGAQWASRPPKLTKNRKTRGY